MKRTLRSILIVLLATVAVVCSALGLAACNEVTLDGLRIENARTEFKIGDEFELGEDFAVYALYSDGTEKDVTEEITYKPEAAFDMDVPGNYQITVSWGGKKEIYTIYVNEFDNVLKKIELNAATVKKEYELGESVDLTGLEIICTYENAQGNPVISKTTSLRNFTVTVTDDDGYVVTDALDKLGEFTVTVSAGAIKDSFKVNVTGVNISTIQGAIAAGKAFQDKVLSGTHVVKNLNPRDDNPRENVSMDYTYEFGINYVYIKETVETKSEFHYSMEGSQIFGVQVKEGQEVPNPNISADYMNGTRFNLWYHSTPSYGVENVLSALYKAAKECTNKDLVETVNVATREYSFKFSGLVFNTNARDYYETEVNFKLGADYNIEHADYRQKYWENSDLEPQFHTNAAGITTPDRKDWFNEEEIVTVDQITGERYKTNPYSRDTMIIQSYDLVYSGQILGDDGVIDCSKSGGNLTIKIENIYPESASFAMDPLYFNYTGNYGGEADSSTMIESEGFMAFRNENTITVIPRNGGVWKLILRTYGTYKTITLNITGDAPTSITPQLYNSATGRFQEGNAKTVAVGGAIYFKGAVNQYANEAQTALVTSSNSTYATVTEETVNGVKCFKFSATQAGTYTVTVTSAVASSVKCTYTFTVNELPDYSVILSGSYTVTDYEGNIFVLEFTPASAGADNGTVVITKTPTTLEDVPIPEQAKTQTLTYGIDPDDFTIVLTSVSGTNLGVKLSVNDQNQLVLTDQYGINYTLNRA